VKITKINLSIIDLKTEVAADFIDFGLKKGMPDMMMEFPIFLSS
jgi:hypothetical protein